MTIEQMIARQQEIVNAARAAGRNMTREESAEFESLQRSIDAARAAGAGIAHGGQSSTPAAAPTNNNGNQRQQTGEGDPELILRQLRELSRMREPESARSKVSAQNSDSTQDPTSTTDPRWSRQEPQSLNT